MKRLEWISWILLLSSCPLITADTTSVVGALYVHLITTRCVPRRSQFSLDDGNVRVHTADGPVIEFRRHVLRMASANAMKVSRVRKMRRS